MAKGIRILDPREPLPWGIENVSDEEVRQRKPVSTIVRFLVVGKSPRYKDQVVLVYNFADSIGTRPPGWGIPGGRVCERETPLEALKKREAGEIPWPIVGKPVHIYTHDRERRDRTERTFIFLVTVNEVNYGEIAPGETPEVSEAKFFSVEEALRLPLVDTRLNATRGETKGIYAYHRQLLVDSLQKYAEMNQEQFSS